ncbi:MULTISPECIES: type II toxin-antitoxin system RelE/ParE family toxin [unclassified Rhizobium]|uniref:type II toxin-antitoxin system RelE/ParE family toxin n=1 Tax=unclassified Rhizobium TaxID=2613769 RepID=UPI000B18F316|nr:MULTISPECIES: type II toxin-antitoxin system RelE/ParE family toxin [unclassified Rhizobium]
MTYTVSFTPAATADLENIFDYIAEKAGEEIARGYVTRIYRYCLGSKHFLTAAVLARI